MLVEEGAALAANAVPLSACATFWKALKSRWEDSSELMALTCAFSAENHWKGSLDAYKIIP